MNVKHVAVGISVWLPYGNRNYQRGYIERIDGLRVRLNFCRYTGKGQWSYTGRGCWRTVDDLAKDSYVVGLLGDKPKDSPGRKARAQVEP